MSGGAVVLGAVLFSLLACNDYQLTVGDTVGIDALAAMGLTVVVGRAGQLALGQAGFMAVGRLRGCVRHHAHGRSRSSSP